MKKLLASLFLIGSLTTVNAADVSSRIRTYNTEEITVTTSSIRPFIGVYGNYGINSQYGGIGISTGIDYENLRFMLSYDFFRDYNKSKHILSAETAYQFRLTNTFRIGPSVGFGYTWSPSHNNLFGSVGVISSVSLGNNWEWTNRYRYIYNGGKNSDHVISSGLTYRF